MIQPDEIPQVQGDLDVLTLCAETLRKRGREFAQTGADIHSAWQGLHAVYRAPEASALLAATVPVRTKAADLGSDFVVIGNALLNYANTVRPLQVRLSTLWAKAWAFRDLVDGHDDWNKDLHKVEQHNRLLADVDAAVAAWTDAQRTCANTIDGLFGGIHWVREGQRGDHQFGFAAAELDEAASAGELAWGKAAEHDLIWWKDAWNDFARFQQSVHEGALHALEGLLDFFGRSGGEQAKESWLGLYRTELLGLPFLLPITQNLPGPHIDNVPKAYEDIGKGLVAWDEWKQDPAKAAGTVTWNVISIVLGTKGVGVTADAISALRAADVTAPAFDVAPAPRYEFPTAHSGNSPSYASQRLSPGHFGPIDTTRLGAVGDRFTPGIDDPGARMLKKEQTLAAERAAEGRLVTRIPESSVKSIDTIERIHPDDPGRRVEYKQLDSNSFNAVKNNIREFLDKFAPIDKEGTRHEGDGIIDGRPVGLDKDTALRGIKGRLGPLLKVDSPKLARVGWLDVVTADGNTITYLNDSKVILVNGRIVARWDEGGQWVMP